MSKRANGEDLSNGDGNAKRQRPAPEDVKEDVAIDEDAEWLAFQEIIAETTQPTNDTTASVQLESVQEERSNIELDMEEETEEDEAGATWDAEDFNVDKRLEEQDKRKRYLEHLRAERDKKLSSPASTKDSKMIQVPEDGDSDTEEEEAEKGWF